MKSIAQIYNALCDATPLTDEELYMGYEHFHRMSQDLVKSGPVFKLSSIEARRSEFLCHDFLWARGREAMIMIKGNKND